MISDCCGAAPITVEEQRGGRIRQSNSEDNGICPECMEDCEYIEDDDDWKCEECEGYGTIVVGHGPDRDEVQCPECSPQPDPDERFEREREMRL